MELESKLNFFKNIQPLPQAKAQLLYRGLMISPKLSNFYVRSGIFTLLSLLGAGLNYALYPILAHILDVSNFGNFTVIVALSNQILAILLAFNIISVTLVKNYNERTAREMAQAIQKILMRFFVAISLLVLIVSPLLKNRLKVEEPFSFFVLTILLIINVPIVVWSGYLQGHKRLINVGGYTFFGALMKFVLALALGAGFGTLGALWGVVGGTISGMALLWFSSDIKLPQIGSVFKRLEANEREYVSKLKYFIVQAVLIVGGLGVLQNIDITYAKTFFSPHTAGIYSGISILSNVLYYVGFLLIWIILPEIDIKNRIHNRRVMSTAYKLLALVAGGVIVLELLFENTIARVLLGQQFAHQGSVLIYATLFQVSLIAVAIYAFYLMVLRSRKAPLLPLAVILPCLILPWFFNDSPRHMILSLLFSVLMGVAFYCIINIFIRRPLENGS